MTRFSLIQNKKRRLALGIGILFSIVMSVLFVPFGGTGGGSSRTALAADDFNYGFVDQSNGNHFSAQFSPSGPNPGSFIFGAWGIGVFTSETPATISVDGAGVMHLTFTGAATLDEGATWERAIGYQYYVPPPRHPGHARIRSPRVNKGSGQAPKQSQALAAHAQNW